MKKSIKLAVTAALVMGATSAFATNGDVMIGQGAKSRAMGGVGIAKGFGAESGLANPAMMSSVESSEVMGAVTFFMPNVNFSSNAGANAFPPEQGGAYPNSVDLSSEKSGSDFSVIPEIAFGQRIAKNFIYGLSITGTAGMGVNYKGKQNGAFDMQTELNILKVAVPLAYSISGFTFGVEPVMQYGSLQINYATPQGASSNPKSSTTGFGYEVGLAYEIAGVTLGAVYKSEIEMEYKDNIAAATKDFGFSPNKDGVPQGIASGDYLNQPAEIGVGIAYEISGHTVAFDYKNIQWGNAKGYKDFGWENQNVYALGYEYATKAWALRLGYNYGKSPIVEQDASSMQADNGKGYENGAINFFNLAGFPGIVEQHITLGGGYQLTKDLGLDASFVYAPETSASYDTTGMTQGMVYQGALQQGKTPEEAGQAAAAASSSSADVTHSQMALSLALNYRF